MKISYHRSFHKSYHRLPTNLQQKVKLILRIFEQDPFAPKLRNHTLNGELSSRRALSVNANIRIIYETLDKHITVLVLDIGGHDQVY